jgi:hypothetical protein
MGSCVVHGNNTKTPDRQAEGFERLACGGFYQLVCNLSRECYNAPTMRYEQAENFFLCIGVRGFDTEGSLFTRLSPEDK